MIIDSELTLVKRAQRGDHAAFEELVRRTSRLVFARLYLETGDTHQAEDLLQDTLLIAYRTVGQLTQPDKFRSWLLRIAQNIAIDAGRRMSVHKRALERETIKSGGVVGKTTCFDAPETPVFGLVDTASSGFACKSAMNTGAGSLRVIMSVEALTVALRGPR